MGKWLMGSPYRASAGFGERIIDSPRLRVCVTTITSSVSTAVSSHGQSIGIHRRHVSAEALWTRIGDVHAYAASRRDAHHCCAADHVTKIHPPRIALPE